MFWRRNNPDPKKAMQSIRIFTAIILASTLLADSFYWITQETANLVIILMSLYILVWSFQEYFVRERKTMMWLLVALTGLLILGIVFFYLGA